MAKGGWKVVETDGLFSAIVPNTIGENLSEASAKALAKAQNEAARKRGSKAFYRAKRA